MWLVLVRFRECSKHCGNFNIIFLVQLKRSFRHSSFGKWSRSCPQLYLRNSSWFLHQMHSCISKYYTKQWPRLEGCFNYVYSLVNFKELLNLFVNIKWGENFSLFVKTTASKEVSSHRFGDFTVFSLFSICLSIHFLLSLGFCLFVCSFFNLSSSSLFPTLIPPFHIYLLSSPYPTWRLEKEKPISYCLHLFSSLSTNVDFTLFIHIAQMVINTRLAHWKICRKLYRATLCDLL